ncbi:MAG: hypothetical protein HOJ90_10945 [Alphaproteobacteria bacterium]|jgi:hypothetical protein|nr:hypothetical protein [Alphaproteobacteria bacterium]
MVNGFLFIGRTCKKSARVVAQIVDDLWLNTMSNDGEEPDLLAGGAYLLDDKVAFAFEEWGDINDRDGLLCYLMMLAPWSEAVRMKARYARAEREC